MPVRNQSSYLALLLMLASLNIEICPAQASLADETETIPERIARIQEVLKQRSTALDGKSSSVSFPGESVDENEVSIWADWSDRGRRRRRGSSGGWVDLFTPGWGDWGDRRRWGDWADLW